MKGYFPGRIEPIASRPTQPSPLAALPCAARPDRSVVCSGFGFDRSVYIGFRLFGLSKRRPGLSSIRWRAREDCLLTASTRRRFVLLSPALLAAAPCAPPTRPTRSVAGFWIRQVEERRSSFVRSLESKNEKRSIFNLRSSSQRS